GGSRHNFVPALAKEFYELLPDEPRAADHYDLHGASPCWSPRVGAVHRPPPPTGVKACRGSVSCTHSLLLFILLGDDDVLDVRGVQHHGQDARLTRLARVP